MNEEINIICKNVYLNTCTTSCCHHYAVQAEKYFKLKNTSEYTGQQKTKRAATADSSQVENTMSMRYSNMYIYSSNITAANTSIASMCSKIVIYYLEHTQYQYFLLESGVFFSTTFPTFQTFLLKIFYKDVKLFF